MNLRVQMYYMEINNRSYLSNDAYAQKQLLNTVEQAQDNISPSEHIKEEQEEKQKSSSATLSNSKNTDESLLKTEQIHEPQSLELLEPINLTRARRLTDTQDDRKNYIVEAHQERISHKAAEALNAYLKVEKNMGNGQEGQELVNRIELMV